LVDSGILISPKKKARDDWKNLIEESLKLNNHNHNHNHNHNDCDADWLNMPLNASEHEEL